MHRTLEMVLPQYKVNFSVAEGPYEDDTGVSSHFDGNAFKFKAVIRQIATIRIDFLSSVVNLGRKASKVLPKFIIGHGQ